MFTSFSTALSALNAHITAVDVIGNNLANVNTPGYKTSAVSFRDLVTQSIGAGLGETQVGFGTGRPFTLRQFSQGGLQSTSKPLDAAIQGDGFFVVKDSEGARLFTRCGNFQQDTDGYLMTLSGERVQGWMEGTDGIVNTNAAIDDIQVPVGTLKTPFATTNFSIDMNLNAGAEIGTPDAAFSTPIEIIDALGGSHVLTVNFTKASAPGEWDYSLTIPGSDVGSTNAFVEVASGSIAFDSYGRLQTPAPDSPTVSFDITGLSNGAPDLSLDWSLYNPNGTPRMTQYLSPSAKSANTQNGTASASLIRVGLTDGGMILAQYSNGQQRVVGRVALASIRNPESLIAVGNNNFQPSEKTALPAIGLPDTGGRGKVAGGFLESSTVDIAKEFTSLIVYQRGYQANSRVVSAVDELSQETINLKR